MFYWDWLNDCLDWKWEQRNNTSSATTKTSYTTTYDGNMLVVTDNTTGDSLKIAKEDLGSKEADEAYKMFMERCKHEEKSKIEVPKYPDFNTTDMVEVTDPNQAWVEHHDFIEKHPNLALYYQYRTTPPMGMRCTVKMMCVNSYEEDGENRYICVVADNMNRIWLIGESGLKKVANA